MSDRDLERFGEDLARHRSVRASDELRRRLRADLMAAPVVFAAPPPQRVPWWRFAAVAASILLVVTAGAGSAAASSLPGEPAFGLKRAYEELQLLVASDDSARADIAVTIAERRLAELQTAAGRPEVAPAAAAAYAEALARAGALVERLRGAAPSSKRDRAILRATESTTKQEAELEELDERLPEPAQKAVERAKEEQKKVTQARDKDKDGKGDGDVRDDDDDATPRRQIVVTPAPARTVRPTPTPTRRGETRPVEPPSDEARD